MAVDPDIAEDVRGHIKSWARWDMNQHWRSGADIHLATDRTYLRRYGFEAPTWLTTNFFAERFSQKTYFSANTYYFQRQRIPLTSNSVPIVVPQLNYSYTSLPDSWGGYWTVDNRRRVLRARSLPALDLGHFPRHLGTHGAGSLAGMAHAVREQRLRFPSNP